ncbi:alpha/beta hydrolase [Thiomicrorhabdus xiamenensis]|uniref:Alpha/beta hydrolase n=1 Tax=Thiomicrorhabdus xiamenensis TaxID=2739063 RepID=A0A7D4NSH5_9GAMM|nr:alpha/beta hydrolase [Thiomicrorhabdus xiamenensis]QKI89977.1 alpha/beta hydrolase [Thiomicrorhabdus xiamenensis]
MLFITNRFPKGSIRSRKNRPFKFDLNNNAPSNSVFYCQRHPDGSMNEIMGENLMSELKKSDYRQVLLYIHGYSNLPDDVFEAAQEFQQLCDREKPKEVLVVPVIWPCDNDLGIINDYWDDQKSADSSASSFSRALNHFMQWRDQEAHKPDYAPCLKRINVLAHSMGNRVLRETLQAWNKYDLGAGVPMLFRNTFLVAADIENESVHRDERGRLISDASRNVVVYFAGDDLALRASKVANVRNKVASRRLGHSGPENMNKTPQNVYKVDCDDVNSRYDLKGHSYFRSDGDGNPGLVFKHIFQCIHSGRVFPEDPDQRSTVIRYED